jgi:hypothetical protein
VTLRVFWLTLFAIGAATVLAFGWQDGEPLTAAAFVVFFASRVWRSVIRRPLSPTPDPAVVRANRFILITAGGYLASGMLATAAALAGEGQEWQYVAPFLIALGVINLYIALFG